jgi:hypothetical protein
VTAIAPTVDAADDLVEEFTYALFVSDFPSRLTTAGNVAFPTSPAHAPTGAVYDFSVWHRLSVDDPLDPFTIEVASVATDAGGAA